jgi:hypothetical protein
MGKGMSKSRERRIRLVERQLIHQSWPRLQVLVIFTFTGLVGFLTSFTLLHVGVRSMWLRYAIVMLIAYGVFLLLLRLWLWMQRNSLKSLNDINADFDMGSEGGGSRASRTPKENVRSARISAASSGSLSESDSASFSSIASADLKEGWLLVLAAILIISGFLASCYIILIAPTLLAEVLVDGVLLAGLYKRVKTIEPQHWLRSAVQRTIVPALIATVCFTAAGYAMQRAVPDAKTIGEVWKHLVHE